MLHLGGEKMCVVILHISFKMIFNGYRCICKRYQFLPTYSSNNCKVSLPFQKPLTGRRETCFYISTNVQSQGGCGEAVKI